MKDNEAVTYCGGAPAWSVQAHRSYGHPLVAMSYGAHPSAPDADPVGHCSFVAFISPAEARKFAAGLLKAADVCEEPLQVLAKIGGAS